MAVLYNPINFPLFQVFLLKRVHRCCLLRASLLLLLKRELTE
jgi:hypothetical protein